MEDRATDPAPWISSGMLMANVSPGRMLHAYSHYCRMPTCVKVRASGSSADRDTAVRRAHTAHRRPYSLQHMHMRIEHWPYSTVISRLGSLRRQSEMDSLV